MIAGWDLDGWEGTLQGASGKGRRLSQITTTKMFPGESYAQAYLWAARMSQLVSAGAGYEVITPEGIRVAGVQFIDLRFRVRVYRGGVRVVCQWQCLAPASWPPAFVENIEDRQVLFP